MTKIKATNQDILIDEDVYEWIVPFSWYITKNRKGSPVVQAHIRDEKNNRTTVSLARFIYEAKNNQKLSDKLVIFPNPADVYNYQMENLIMLTKAELGKKGGRPVKAKLVW